MRHLSQQGFETHAAGTNIQKSYRKWAAVRKCSVNSRYSQHHEHTAAKKSRQGRTGRYPKCQLNPQVNRAWPLLEPVAENSSQTSK